MKRVKSYEGEKMGKFYVTIRTKFGEISIEGDSKKEVLNLLKEAVTLIDDIKTLIPEEKIIPLISAPPVPPLIMKKKIEGIIEVTVNGRPHIIIPPEKLAAKDIIGLLLYWKYPEGLSMKELTDLVSLNWKAVKPPYVSANIGDMKGLILKEGPRGKYIYKLSGTGKSWVENDLLPKIRGERK